MKSLFVFLLLSLFGQAMASNIILNGICYSIDNNVVSVVGGYYDSSNRYIQVEYSGTVIIPESFEYEGQSYSVTRIADDAFRGCSALTSVVLPSCLKSIGGYAFEGCIGLTEIHIPKDVNSINQSAFRGCTKLGKIVVDSENKRYDSRDNCNAIVWSSTKPYIVIGCKNSTIPEGIIRIGQFAFRGCLGLTDIELPNSLESIGESAFEGCADLININFPKGLTTIEGNAFKDCVGLTSIQIPNSTTTIGVTTTGGYYYNFTEGLSAFSGCSGLESIIVEDGNLIYDSRNGCNAIIESATNTLIVGCKNTVIPNSVSEIWIGAFQHCSELKTIHIPSSISHIYASLFSGCTGLQSITVDGNNPVYDSRDNCNAIIESTTNKLILGCRETMIPNSIKSIGEYSFGHVSYYYRNMEQLPIMTIIIPESVEEIGEYAFESCRLENVIAKNPKTRLGENSFLTRSFQHTMLYIPIGTWSEAVYDGGWYLFNNIRETAMESAKISANIAYTMMEAQTGGYAVFDGVNDKVQMSRAFYSIDESNPNNSWQIINQNGQHYLYNIGARKFAEPTDNGDLRLTQNPKPLNMTDTESGIIIDNSTHNKWYFVMNNEVSVGDVSAIESLVDYGNGGIGYYSINGQQIKSAKKGINIIRLSNGNAKKFIIR